MSLLHSQLCNSSIWKVLGGFTLGVYNPAISQTLGRDCRWVFEAPALHSSPFLVPYTVDSSSFSCPTLQFCFLSLVRLCVLLGWSSSHWRAPYLRDSSLALHLIHCLKIAASCILSALIVAYGRKVIPLPSTQSVVTRSRSLPFLLTTLPSPNPQ